MTGMERHGKVRKIFGRRQGHKLSPRQQGLMDALLPKVAIDVDLENYSQLDLAQAFGGQQWAQCWLEIGFGGAEHLAHQARNHPDVSMIGCEPFINGIAKLLTFIEEDSLENVRFFDDGRDLVKVMPDASVDRIFLLYPDPWPKKRHNKRRFVSDETLREFARILKPGGLFHFASDIPDYVSWTLMHIAGHDDFEWLADKAEDWRNPPQDWVQTRYEAKAYREGRVPCYLNFKKKS